LTDSSPYWYIKLPSRLEIPEHGTESHHEVTIAAFPLSVQTLKSHLPEKPFVPLGLTNPGRTAPSPSEASLVFTQPATGAQISPEGVRRSSRIEDCWPLFVHGLVSCQMWIVAFFSLLRDFLDIHPVIYWQSKECIVRMAYVGVCILWKVRCKICNWVSRGFVQEKSIYTF